MRHALRLPRSILGVVGAIAIPATFVATGTGGCKGSFPQILPEPAAVAPGTAPSTPPASASVVPKV